MSLMDAGIPVVSTACRQLLCVAAALGPRLEPERIAEAIGQSTAALLPAWDEAIEGGVLTAADGELRFARESVRQAVLDSMPAAIRRALLRRYDPARAEPGRPAEGLLGRITGRERAVLELVAQGRSKSSRSVLVLDDHPVVRRGMAALLALEPWVGDVHQADTLAEGQHAAEHHLPDLAIVDLRLPDGDAAELIRRLAQASPGCVSLVLSMNADTRAVRSALDAGAAGYLLKDAAPEVIIAAARTVAAGGTVFGPGVTRGDAGRPPAPFDVLNPRELRLLLLLAEGHSSRSVAEQLTIAEKTVRNQVSAVLTKIGARDRAQAVLLAHRVGLVQ
jgi:DNA-binding NarL/FixJ family response regulator